MNHFEYEQTIDDLGVTVIENAFLNHYMPNARGDYVKVYLFGLKICMGQSHFPTNLQIAQVLKLTESDVINAWKYWDSQGVIDFTQNGSDCTIEYQKISCKLFINGNGEMKDNEKKSKKTRYSAKIKQMNRDIEEKICRPLTHREIEAFLDWIETFGFTPQTVVLLVSDCIDRDKRDASYWQSMALVFYNAGIKTYDQAQQFLQSRDVRWKEYKEILNYLGFYRLPTKPEKTYIDKWLDEYKLSMKEIKAACDETIKTNRPSIKYVDGVLCNGNNKCSAETKKKTGKKTKLEYDHEYDMDQIEESLFGNG